MNSEEEQKVRHLLDMHAHAAQSVRDEIKAYLEQLCARLSRDDFRFRLTEARIKEPPRIIKKLERANARPDQLYDVVTDLIGLRVVVYNRSDVEVFKKAISEDPSCPLDELVPQDVNYKSGYKALHIDGRAGGTQRMGCEIQVRTALQDAWAVTSRADIYESEDDIDPVLTDLAQAQSEIVGAVDTVFQHIRNLRERSRQHVDAEEIRPADEQPAQRPPGPSPPGLDHERIKRATGALDPGERHVLSHPISEQRVEELRSGILELRRKSSLRRLFHAAGAYQRLSEYRSDYRFGQRMLAWKGPLVDGSNWAAFSPEDFASSLERFTHIQLCHRLREDSPPQESLVSWQQLAAFARAAADKLAANNGHADVIVVIGAPDATLYEIVDFATPASVRDTLVTDVRGVTGTVISLPVFRPWAQESGPTCAYVVDLARSCSYTQTNPNAMTDDDLYLWVDPVTFEKAVDLLEKNPDRLQPPGGPRFTREEQVVRLQLQVGLHVIEGGRVEAAEPGFAIGALVEAAQAPAPPAE